MSLVYPMLEQIRTLCFDEHCQSSRFVLFFDSKVSFRRRQYAFYKAARRAKTVEEKAASAAMRQQIDYAINVAFPKLKIEAHTQLGVEADDLLAQAAAQLTLEGDRGVMITADNDLYQCITGSVAFCDPHHKKFYTPELFEAEYKIRPCDWREVKMLAGCSGDGVPGIPGVGVKTALQYLLGKLERRSRRRVAIESDEGRAIAERNRDLVCLPYPATRPISLAAPKWSYPDLVEFCQRSGLDALLRGDRERQWRALCSGRVGVTARQRGSARRVSDV